MMYPAPIIIIIIGIHQTKLYEIYTVSKLEVRRYPIHAESTC